MSSPRGHGDREKPTAPKEVHTRDELQARLMELQAKIAELAKEGARLNREVKKISSQDERKR